MLPVRPIRRGVAQASGAAAVVTRRAADRLREGHLWVYRSDVEELSPGAGGEDVGPGGLVTVTDSRRIPLGTGLYSSASQIAVRMVSAAAGLTRAAYLKDVRTRVEAAIALRAKLAPMTEADNAHRVLFAEADDLPGMVADRYNDLVILQLLTQGTAEDDVRGVLAECLGAMPGVRCVVERPDPRMRELEELPAPPAGALYTAGLTDGEAGLATIFTLNGLRFHFDAGSGQKTGAFLDQRQNYAAAAAYGHGRALDVCTYQGGFALHLARTCTRVTGVDASRGALEVADRNLGLNPGLGAGPGSGRGAGVDWIEADAFDLLRDFEADGQRFDTIVLDPPAFAKSKRAMESALRGYKEMNLRALKMLSAGGTLVTCSCSHHISLAEFQGVVTAAATDAGRRVQLLETRGAAPDHPQVLTLPETGYLKCLICRVN